MFTMANPMQNPDHVLQGVQFMTPLIGVGDAMSGAASADDALRAGLEQFSSLVPAAIVGDDDAPQALKALADELLRLSRLETEAPDRTIRQWAEFVQRLLRLREQATGKTPTQQLKDIALEAKLA
jgi:hypothetical protein